MKIPLLVISLVSHSCRHTLNQLEMISCDNQMSTAHRISYLLYSSVCRGLLMLGIFLEVSSFPFLSKTSSNMAASQYTRGGTSCRGVPLGWEDKKYIVQGIESFYHRVSNLTKFLWVTCASIENTEHLLTPLLPQLYARLLSVSYMYFHFGRCSTTIDIITALTTNHHQSKLPLI